jgi:general secretion pathway protein G
MLGKIKGTHRGQGGFTLMELMVVLAILAFLVGLVLPNFFKITEDAPAIIIQGQREKMMEAVYMYHQDCDQWPTELSGAALTTEGDHQLWNNEDDLGTGTVDGWDGPYVDRPIFQQDKWGGEWGVLETVALTNPAGNFTCLVYQNVPTEVYNAVEASMDDGTTTTGAVQQLDVLLANGKPGTDGVAEMVIIIAKE